MIILTKHDDGFTLATRSHGGRWRLAAAVALAMATGGCVHSSTDNFTQAGATPAPPPLLLTDDKASTAAPKATAAAPATAPATAAAQPKAKSTKSAAPKKTAPAAVPAVATAPTPKPVPVSASAAVPTPPTPPPLPTADASTGGTEAFPETAPAVDAAGYPNINAAPAQPGGTLLPPEERKRIISELEALRAKQKGGTASGGSGAAALAKEAETHGPEAIQKIEKCADDATAASDPDCQAPATQ